MKIQAPATPPRIALVDIKGEPVQIGGGRRLLLSLFREANCPFCNFRVYDLTNNYPNLAHLGLDIVAVFKSDVADINKFIAQRARPFRIVADPQGNAHEAFTVNTSRWGKIKAMMLRMPALVSGIGRVGLRGMATGNLMPADFLIDENGIVVEAYYGRDAGDHIPMERIELFAARGLASKTANVASQTS